MAYGDPIVIQPQSEGATPVRYSTAARQVVEATTATATYDGTGAAGDFIPALAFYAQNGRLLARAVASTTVAAGDTAEVSWFPFAPPGSAAAAGVIAQEVVTGAVNPPGRLPGLLGTCQWSHSSGDVLLDYLGTTRPYVIAAGSYSFACYMQVSGFTLSAGVLWRVEIDVAPLTAYTQTVVVNGQGDGSTADYGETAVTTAWQMAASDQVLPQFLHEEPATTLEATATLYVSRFS